MTLALPTPLIWSCNNSNMVGFIHTPERPADQAVILVAGGTQTRIGPHRILVDVAQHLAAMGIAVLRFDVRGRGDSGGEYPGFEKLEADIDSARAALLKAIPAVRQVFLLGHCDGAAACAFAVAKGIDANGLILLNPWARTAETSASYANASQTKNLSNIGKWKRIFTGKVNVFTALKSLFKSVMSSAPIVVPATGLLADWQRAWATLSCPTLVITGENDASGHEFLALLPSLRGHPSLSREVIESGDHSFSTPRQKAALLDLITQWLQRVGRTA